MMHVLIVDDHPLFADALRQVSLRLGEHIIVHIAESVEAAIRLVEYRSQYDLMLLDINLPGLDGFSFMRQLQRRFINTPVVMICSSTEPSMMRHALEQGAMAYVPKSIDAKSLLHAAHQVLRGNIYFPNFPKDECGREYNKPISLALHISQRQLAVLQLIASGLSNKEIARQLKITESTVKTHVSKLMSALIVNNRTSCILEAQRLGLL